MNDQFFMKGMSNMCPSVMASQPEHIKDDRGKLHEKHQEKEVRVEKRENEWERGLVGNLIMKKAKDER